MEENLRYAYLAGLFDGEGTITLTRINSSDKFRAPILSMSSTSLNLLELCKSTFGGHISKQKVYKDHYKQAWSWKIAHNAALEAATKLLPFIQEPEKKRRLQLLITRYKLVTNRGGHYSEELLSLKLNFEEEFFHPSNSVASLRNPISL